jgi:hypothetical protein
VPPETIAVARPATLFQTDDVLELSMVSDFDALDEDRRDRVVEYWEDFLEMAADEGQHNRILKDCQQMPR